MPKNLFRIEIDMDHMRHQFNSIPFAAVFFDEEGNIIETNAAMLQATGYTYMEIKQKTFRDLFVIKDTFISWVRYCNRIQTKLKRVPRGLLKLYSGDTCMSDLIVCSDEQQEGGLHFIMLPSIQYASDHAMLQDLYPQMITHMNMGALILNEKACIAEINQAACDILGVEKRQVINQTIEKAFPGMKEDQGFISSAVLKGVTVTDKAYSWFNGDQRFELLVDSDIIKDASGRIKGGYYLFKNVTNMRSFVDKIERSDRLAMIGQIAAGTAHEIRNPLTSINGFLQMMSRSLAEAGLEKEKGYTDIMLVEVKRINDLVSEFLLLSKQKEIQYKMVDIEQVCMEIFPIVENEALLRGVEVVLKKEGTLPPVMGDSELLKQVLLNISKNGIEAMGGKGTLTVHLFPMGSEIEITIHDTGPGIPTYLADKIFEPFFTTKEEGTGLGLPVCQKIIHDMGGTIRVSNKGYGTTFHIILPSC